MTGRIYFNQKQSSTTELEAELLGFDPEVESKHDDLMDALAYIMEFIAHRTFEAIPEDEEYEYEEDYDDDESYFETTCPVCQEEIVFDEDTLDSGEIRCPKCGEKLEFDLSDLANAKDSEDDE